MPEETKGQEKEVLNDEEAIKNEALFMSFISTMADTVMQQLGKVMNPLTNKLEKNLQAAKASIDIMMMLKEKTKGNLSEREERFFASILSTLQLNYVDEIKKEEEEKKHKGKNEEEGKCKKDM
jgi:hypothetical protein